MCTESVFHVEFCVCFTWLSGVSGAYIYRPAITYQLKRAAMELSPLSDRSHTMTSARELVELLFNQDILPQPQPSIRLY